MEHNVNIPVSHEEHKGNPNEVRNVTIILSVLTVVELLIGYWMYASPMGGFMTGLLKGVIIILMLAKAFYIVAYFMHLGHEIKNFVMTIIVPLALFFWFIIAFLYDGDSYKNLRNKYNRHHYEESNKPYNAPHDKDAQEDVQEQRKNHKPEME